MSMSIDGSNSVSSWPVASTRDLYPWLMYHHGRNQSFCRISSSGPVSIESKTIAELRTKKVLFCTTDGRWLILLDEFNVQTLSIWNPATHESIELPPMPRELTVDYGAQALLSSSSPHDPSCMVVLLNGYHVMLHCRVGDEDWSELDYKERIEDQKSSCMLQSHLHHCCQLRNPVCSGRRMYALSSCHFDLVQIEFDEDDPLICQTTVLLPEPKYYDEPLPVTTLFGSVMSYLVPWRDGELYRITVSVANSMYFKSRELPEVNVARFDFDTNYWVKVSSLSGGAVFLDHGYSLSLPSSSSDDSKWSYIYFTSPDNNQMLCSYRMEDEKITSYSPFPPHNLPPSFPSLWWCPPRWIMPAHTEPEPELERPLQTKVVVGFGQKILQWIEVGKRFLYQVSGIGDGAGRPAYRSRSKRCSKRQKTRVSETSLSDLSPKLVGLIAECIPSFVDYIHFLSVHYDGNSIVRTRKNPFHPCLIFRDKANGAYHITDSKLTRKLSVELPEALKHKNICCSSEDGWLLLRENRSFSLFNPFTSQTVNTRGFNLGETDGYDHYGVSNATFFGKLEDFSVLTMALTFSSKSSQIELENVPAVRGKAEWWLLKMGRADMFEPSPNSPAVLGGVWYYLGFNGKLGALRLIDDNSVWKVDEDLVCPCVDYTRNYLVECNGELVSVFVFSGDDLRPVRVFKRNEYAVCWEEMDSLEGYCLFVGWPSSMSCVADTWDMADRIYFPRFYKDGLVYYSLKTSKFHSVGNDQEELKSSYRTTMYSDCAWIKLAWNEQL